MQKFKKGKRQPTIAVLGDAQIARNSPKMILAESIGKALVDAGYRVMTGGLGGVMESAHKGARSSKKWTNGTCIGLLPGSDPNIANEYVDIVIPTGLDHARNMIVAQSDAVIAIGGGAGTLSEMAFAWIYRRLIIGLHCDGWSSRLAGHRIDERIRYPDIIEDKVFGADSASEAISLLAQWLPKYNKSHKRIA